MRKFISLVVSLLISQTNTDAVRAADGMPMPQGPGGPSDFDDAELLASVAVQKGAVRKVNAAAAAAAANAANAAGNAAAAAAGAIKANVNLPPSVPKSMVKAIDKIQDSVPKTIKYQFGQGDSKVKVKLNVDQARVKDYLGYEKKFWQDDASKLQRLPMQFIQPLERTKVRIAASLSGILKPLAATMQAATKMLPGGKCQPYQFFDCLSKLPRNQRRGSKILYGACAKNSGCVPQVINDGSWSQADSQARQAAFKIAQAKGGKKFDRWQFYRNYCPERKKAWCAARNQMRDNKNKLRNNLGILGGRISRDFDQALQKVARTIQPMAQKWMRQSMTIMINDFRCDKKCIQREFGHGCTNPIDYLQGKCGCRLPISPGAVLDWQVEDFDTVSMEEWMDIAEENQNIDLEEDEVEAVTLLPDAKKADNKKDDKKADKKDVKKDDKKADKKDVKKDDKKVGDKKDASGSSAWVWWVVGAVVILVVAFGIYWWKFRKDSEGGQMEDMYTKFI